MAHLMPNTQRRYYQQNSPSSTHLLAPGPNPGPSPSFVPNARPVSPQAQSVQAAFAQTPRSVRHMASDVSLVRVRSLCATLVTEVFPVISG